jgi:REP element-mobilizing transposase RayT
MRRRFNMRLYGYVVMPEHVHLLLSEPERGTLAEAMHYLKLSFAKRVRGRKQAFAQVSLQGKDANLGPRPPFLHCLRNAVSRRCAQNRPVR